MHSSVYQNKMAQNSLSSDFTVESSETLSTEQDSSSKNKCIRSHKPFSKKYPQRKYRRKYKKRVSRDRNSPVDLTEQFVRNTKQILLQLSLQIDDAIKFLREQSTFSSNQNNIFEQSTNNKVDHKGNQENIANSNNNESNSFQQPTKDQDVCEQSQNNGTTSSQHILRKRLNHHLKNILNPSLEENPAEQRASISEKHRSSRHKYPPGVSYHQVYHLDQIKEQSEFVADVTSNKIATEYNQCHSDEYFNPKTNPLVKSSTDVLNFSDICMDTGSHSNLSNIPSQILYGQNSTGTGGMSLHKSFTPCYFPEFETKRDVFAYYLKLQKTLKSASIDTCSHPCNGSYKRKHKSFEVRSQHGKRFSLSNFPSHFHIDCSCEGETKVERENRILKETMAIVDSIFTKIPSPNPEVQIVEHKESEEETATKEDTRDENSELQKKDKKPRPRPRHIRVNSCTLQRKRYSRHRP